MKNVITMSGLICLIAVFAGPSWGDSLDDAWAQTDKINAAAASLIKRAGHVTGNDPRDAEMGDPLKWVVVIGGAFMMGTDSGAGDAKPIHPVAIKTFEISRTLVTVDQYEECVMKGQCTKPGTFDGCNWKKVGRDRNPINCVDWQQATQYAKFKGARLPTEAEWEYAATSGGKNQKYPWGNEDATCERAVMYGNGSYGCGSGGTLPVCSKPAGNAKVSGGELCDMAGNVWQWVQDGYQSSYANAPADGSASEACNDYRVMRGGSFISRDTFDLRADYRSGDDPRASYISLGFRLARDVR